MLKSFITAIFLTASLGTSYAAEEWKSLGSDRIGQWSIDSNSVHKDGMYVKVTLRVWYPTVVNKTLRDKSGSIQKTIPGVKGIVGVEAIDCNRRLRAITSSAYLNDAGHVIHSASWSRPAWEPHLKDPEPGSMIYKVVDAACTSANPRQVPPRIGTTPVAPSGPRSSSPSETPPKQTEADNGEATVVGKVGTGVVINNMGHVLTNNHVVDACATITVYGEDGKPKSSRKVGADKKNDLAFLITDYPGLGTPMSLRVGNPVKSGESLLVIGFPFAGLLSSEPNVSVGNVSATSGIQDDVSVFQLSAPIHSGNSGGPVVDSAGLMIGLVSSKLNSIAVAKATGDIPQNIGFGIKTEVIELFLNSKSVPFNFGTGKLSKAGTAEVASKAKRSVVKVVCK